MSAPLRDDRPRHWPEDKLQHLRACPVCGGTEASVLHRDLTDRLYAAPGTWRLLRCRGCGCGYLDPRPSPDSIDLVYAGYYTHTTSKPATSSPQAAPLPPPQRIKRGLRNAYLNHRYGCELTPSYAAGRWIVGLSPLARRAQREVRYLPPANRASPPRLLDVGCGNGEFLRKMGGMGWEVHGIEPDPQAVRVAAACGIPTHCGSLADHPYPDDHFDAITLYHVIEHLHQPLEAMRACHRLLRRGGTLAVFTPNIDSLGHRAFGRDWHPLHPPAHLILFVRATLRGLLRQAGFDSVSSRPSFASSSVISASRAFAARTADPESSPVARRLLPFAQSLSYTLPNLAEEIILVARKR